MQLGTLIDCTGKGLTRPIPRPQTDGLKLPTLKSLGSKDVLESGSDVPPPLIDLVPGLPAELLGQRTVG